jgi:hypothetical protein
MNGIYGSSSVGVFVASSSLWTMADFLLIETLLIETFDNLVLGYGLFLLPYLLDPL